MVQKFGFESWALRLGTPGILVLVGDSRTPGRTISFHLREEKVRAQGIEYKGRAVSKTLPVVCFRRTNRTLVATS